MIIKPENLTLVFKCHDCGKKVKFFQPDIDLNELIINGLEDCICDECEYGELELSHFETK